VPRHSANVIANEPRAASRSVLCLTGRCCHPCPCRPRGVGSHARFVPAPLRGRACTPSQATCRGRRRPSPRGMPSHARRRPRPLGQDPGGNGHVGVGGPRRPGEPSSWREGATPSCLSCTCATRTPLTTPRTSEGSFVRFTEVVVNGLDDVSHVPRKGARPLVPDGGARPGAGSLAIRSEVADVFVPRSDAASVRCNRRVPPTVDAGAALSERSLLDRRSSAQTSTRRIGRPDGNAMQPHPSCPASRPRIACLPRASTLR
jgi:hypothetical protein